jgi:hypothetical protein
MVKSLLFVDRFKEQNPLIGVVLGYVVFIGAFYLSIHFYFFFPPEYPLFATSQLLNMGLTLNQAIVMQTLGWILIWVVAFTPLFVTLVVSISWFSYLLQDEDAKPVSKQRIVYRGVLSYFLAFFFLLLFYGFIFVNFSLFPRFFSVLPYPFDYFGILVLWFVIVFVFLFCYFLVATVLPTAQPKRFLRNCFSYPFFWLLLIILYLVFIRTLFISLGNIYDVEETLYIKFFMIPFHTLPLAILLPGLPLVFIFFGHQRQF